MIISSLVDKVLRISPHSWAHPQPNMIKVKGSIQPESTLTPRSRVAFLLLNIHPCKGSLRGQSLNHRNHQGIGQLYFHTLAKSSLVIWHMLWGVSCQYTDSLAGDRICGEECKEIGNTAHITYKLSNMQHAQPAHLAKWLEQRVFADQFKSTHYDTHAIISHDQTSLTHPDRGTPSRTLSKFRTEIRRNGPCSSRHGKQDWYNLDSVL